MDCGRARPQPAVARLAGEHDVSADDAHTIASDPALQAFFDEARAVHPNARLVANWVVNEVGRELKSAGAKGLPFRGAAIGELCALVEAGTISGKIAKDLFAELVKNGGSPKAMAERQGIQQISDAGAVAAAVDAVLAENPDMIARYRAGNVNLLGALVGLTMKKTGGKANPQLVNETLKRKLG